MTGGDPWNSDGPRCLGTLSWPTLFVGLWLVGVILGIGRSGIAAWRAHRLVHRASEIGDATWQEQLDESAASLSLRHRVRLLRADRVCIPMTCGWWRSVVIVPTDADRWSDDRRRVVLCHELAHIKRGDVWTGLLADVASAIYWFHPLAWYARRRLRVEREHACDDMVLGLGTKPSDYGRHLVEIARHVRAPEWSASAAIGMAQPSQLEGRLRAILTPRSRRRATRTAAVVVVALAIGVVGAVSAFTPDTGPLVLRGNLPRVSSPPPVFAIGRLGTKVQVTSLLPGSVLRMQRVPGDPADDGD